ncbi:hypothetical protein [Diaphorobacter nitroreducens]
MFDFFMYLLWGAAMLALLWMVAGVLMLPVYLWVRGRDSLQTD